MTFDALDSRVLIEGDRFACLLRVSGELRRDGDRNERVVGGVLQKDRRRDVVDRVGHVAAADSRAVVGSAC